MSERRQADSRLRWLLLATAVVLLLTGLSTRDLWQPDEPRIAMVAEELRSMRHGPEGLALLHLSGEPYTQKPPLYYWLVAAAAGPERVTEAAARLPSALAGVALVALTASFGARLLGAPTGLLGGALLLSLYYFAKTARRAQFDVLLALFEVIALVGFWRLDRGVGGRAANLALMHGAMGLAVLTKGPVGFLVPLLAIAVYLAWERRLRTFPHLVPPWALLLSLGPGLVWIATASALAPPGFFGEAVGTNLFGRFFEGTSHARPIYYYLWRFPLDFLPWALLWPLGAWVAHRRVFARDADPERARVWRLLLAWVGAALVFFTLSSGKRGLYLLPAFPAAALLCADVLVLHFGGRRELPRGTGTGAAVFLGALAVATALFAADVFSFVSMSWAVPIALALCLVLAATAWRMLARADAPALARFGVLIGGVLAVEFVAFSLYFPTLNRSKTLRPVAGAAAAITRPDEPIGLVGAAPKLGAIAFYSDRTVVQLGGEESIRRFLDDGGRIVVVQARKAHRLEAVTDFEVRSRIREGRRAWMVVSARPTRSPPGTGDGAEAPTPRDR